MTAAVLRSLSTPSLLKREGRKKWLKNCFPFFGHICIYLYIIIPIYIYFGSCFRGEKMFFRDVGCQLLACLDGKVGWRRWKK